MKQNTTTSIQSANPLDGRTAFVSEPDEEMRASLPALVGNQLDGPVRRSRARTLAPNTFHGGSTSTAPSEIPPPPTFRRYVRSRFLALWKLNTFAVIIFFLTYTLCMIATLAISLVMRDMLEVSVSQSWGPVQDMKIITIENYIQQQVLIITGTLQIDYSLVTSNMVRNLSSYVTQVCATLAFNINAGYSIMESYRLGSGHDIWTGCYYRENASEPSGYTMGAIDMFFTGHLQGVYTINQTTYTYIEPFQQYGNLTYYMSDGLDEYLNEYLNSTVFTMYNATRDLNQLPESVFWDRTGKNPSIYTCIYPVPNVKARNRRYPNPDAWRYNYMEILVNASKLLPTWGSSASRAMLLRYGDWSGGPIVISNTWGQLTTNYTTLSYFDEDVTYYNMRVSDIQDEVMLAALKHIDVYTPPTDIPIKTMVTFTYKYSRAIVTIWDYNTSGFNTRIVLVSAQHLITGNTDFALELAFGYLVRAPPRPECARGRLHVPHRDAAAARHGAQHAGEGGLLRGPRRQRARANQ
ncbi:hypothetical protein STCU_12286 [Strigomonas culicis]|uniref:Uncharacterized protein n=1 Tax=Strigomonas culicis TaxID=28005 RepID=S9TE04_9TRYP|nr:hypothetical protein STCU_12286 [Strigomonas culicis]|eukprot:EPY15174.1 hypothetical protein STCU_12286 [Strigomonas culicis]